MPEPIRRGRGDVAAAMRRQVQAAIPDEPPYLTGTVAGTASGPTRVLVDVPGYRRLECPYLASYAPAVGHLVVLGRVGPGYYLCLGRQA